MRKTIAVSYVGGSMLCVLSIAQTVLAGPPCGEWVSVESPSPGAYSGLLRSVAAHGPDQAWAVGFHADGPASLRQPLALNWDGSVWSEVGLPSTSHLGSEPVLRGVAAVPGGDFWVAGYVTTGYPTDYMPLVMRRDGGGWTDVATPALRPQREYPYGPRGGFGEAVLALAEHDVWVIGTAAGYGDATATSVALALHWDGSSWADVEVPIVGNRSNHLVAVSGVAGDDVWAVGEWRSVGGTYKALIQHWDGSAWSHVPHPAESIAQTFLDDVAAAASNDVWALGSINYSQPLLMHFDGSEWSIVQGPPGGTAITAAGPNDVWIADVAAGWYYHWDGETWTPVAAPAVPPGALFDASHAMTVVGPCDVWSVGTTTYSSGASRTLTHRLLDGSTPAGDLNGDGCVDFADLVILLGAYGVSADGDIDGDADTDFADLIVLLGNYGSGNC